tara:strand:+ start:172 stop:558 length:387 start_codon:yes stop_codon:yes gene_type:complete
MTLEDSLSMDDYDILMPSIGEDYEKATGLLSLIEKGIDLNQVIDESSGLHPIHWASDYGNQKAVEILLEAGIDINIVDESFMPFTAMERAAKGGYVDLVKLFLNKGAKKTEMTKLCIGSNKDIESLLG